MDRLTPLDSSFLYVEDATFPMHIGSVGVCTGPPPDYDEFVRRIAAKLELVPRYRQKIRFVPLQMGRPVWVDDPHFNIEYHIRRTALPSPGGPEELKSLVGRVMSQHLDRHRPLWETWIVEGLPDDRWAVLMKAHHCMVDGIAGSDLMAVIFDLGAADPAPTELRRFDAAPEPSDCRLLAESLKDFAFMPREQVRLARSLASIPVQTLAEIGRGIRNWFQVARPTAVTSLSGDVGPHRRWEYAEMDLDAVKRIAHTTGGTVNDVVMAVVAGGFRDLLLSRGDDITRAEVHAFVPVSVRREDERGSLHNRVSGMVATLPVSVADPRERLARVRDGMRSLKDSGEVLAGEIVEELSAFVPPLLLALGERAALGLAGRNLTTVVTNVPGPQFPLYAGGRKLEELYPYVGLGPGMRINVAVLSYDGGVGFGVTGDWETAPDLAILRRGIVDALEALLETVGAAPP